ncbi:hypothetical protein [Lentzea sp. NPDC003310]|uniref:hypothetical protein n=1 Tax=Lentzea sp. NPDC003310 TaxID=3154447 RepID=UPI00339DE1FA
MAGDREVIGVSGIRAQHRLSSHHGLLYSAPRDSPQDEVDAMIVPSVRHPHALKHAVELAFQLKCVLVVLCSKHSSARAIARWVAEVDVPLIAIDTGRRTERLLLRFRTCDLLEKTRFRRFADTSHKRNLGLAVARMAGWERIVFLDDDIEVPDPADLRRAAALTDRFGAAGLNLHGYPDNSVVFHAHREVGGDRNVFVGAGALAVSTRSSPSFFPNIYNEDWFFLLNGESLTPTAVTGIAWQKPYDPFTNDTRARAEELGDVLAEGLFWLLHEGRSLREANTDYWRRYLCKRQNFIIETVNRILMMKASDSRQRMLNSLKAASGRSQVIRPELCEAFVQAWREDRRTWSYHLERIQPSSRQNFRGGDVHKVLADIGILWT